MQRNHADAVPFVQSVVLGKWRRCFVAIAALLVVSASGSCSPVFAQFGGTIKDITAKFEEPMRGGPFVNEIEGFVPKFPAGKNKKSRTALTRWEVTRGGPIFSAWTLDGGIQNLHFDFKGKVSEEFVFRLLDRLTVKDENTEKAKRITWPPKQEPKLLLPFPPPPFAWHQESVGMAFINVRPPEYANGLATEWFQSFTDDPTGDPGGLQRSDAEGRVTVKVVREVKTWRRSIRVSIGQKYVAAYDAHDWQLFELNTKTPKLLRMISQVGSLTVMTPELYLASNVRVTADMREGKNNYEPPFESLRKVGLNRNQIDAYYAENLRAVIDHPSVPWEWLDLNHPKAHELQEIVDNDIKNLSLTSKVRRVEALAKRGRLSKLATNLISELNNKRSQAEALAGLETAAKLLKREPAVKLENDTKGWTKWYDETKDSLVSGDKPESKKIETPKNSKSKK